MIENHGLTSAGHVTSQTDATNQETEGACPVPHGQSAARASGGPSNAGWWPDRLNLKILAKNPSVANPFGAEFDYSEAFESLDLAAVKADIAAVLTTSQPWWPADFNNYGPLVIRMAWHAAGTYRIYDGRGGAGTAQQRFAPLNSWPDNANLDKARRLMWPVKQKYGRSLSWGDLIVLTGNVALEIMGLPTFGFGGGRVDAWEPDDDVFWGPETTWLGNTRYHGDRELEKPLAAVQMGLIYVNPEGPDGNPDPLASARDIRETFKRMAMNDEETVALIAGGHTFGKTHGAGPDSHHGPSPENADLAEQGLGWANDFGTGVGDDTITSGLEVTWTYNPTRWDNEYFQILFGYEWELMTSPGGAHQWRPVDGGGADTVPLAHDASKRREPRMLTTDIALRADPIYESISRRFAEDQDALSDAFARAWFKLTHRDMGPKVRYLGAEVPEESLIWQDPLPKVTSVTISADEIATLKERILASDLTVAELVSTAWASASSFRGSDKRGGANGARIRFEPQRSWEVNNPTQLARVLDALDGIRTIFNASAANPVSLADLIVLAGSAAVEKAAQNAGVGVAVPFTPGRVDAQEDETDAESFEWLEPVADGFRNYYGPRAAMPAEHHLIDRANLLTLSAPEMTVLLGGMRALATNYDGSKHGVFSKNPNVLSNDFFVTLLDIATQWTALDAGMNAYQGSDSSTGVLTATGTRVDLLFGSNSELRAIAEVYASDDARVKFVEDFVAAWVKVMELDRFDLT